MVKKEVITKHGWVWYCNQIKEQTGKEFTSEQAQDIMTKYYIKGKPWQEALAGVFEITYEEPFTLV